MNSFMGKVKSKLNEGVNVVSTKSKSLIETTKINAQISALESNKKAVYEELGKEVCIMFGNGNMDIDAIGKRYTEIHSLQSSIEEKRELIKQIQGEEQDTLDKSKPSPCKCCEAVETSEPAPVPANTSQSEDTKLCECGAVLRESAKFCGSCGKIQGDL